MTFYSEVAQEAKSLLAEFGQLVTLRNITLGAYDVNTGTASEVISDQSNLNAVILNYSTKDIDGTNIRMDDRRVIIESIAIPDLNSLIIIGGVTYNVVSFEYVSPSGENVICKIQIRKS